MSKWIVWAAMLGILAACGSRTPDAERGGRLYRGALAMPGGNLACIECHPVVPGEEAEVMGQNLADIGARAGATVPGQSAEEYLRTAIVDPDAFLSGGFQEGIHPRAYAEDLSERDVADLVAYMLTLRSR